MANKSHYQALYVKRLRRRVRSIYKYRCPCGKPGKQFAHVQPTKLSGEGRGRIERYLDVLRNPGSYCLVCSYRCHAALDRGELDPRTQRVQCENKQVITYGNH